MKKALKVIGIVLVSLLGVVAATIGIACWLIFTPARLTPIAQKAADKYISCDTHIGKANITLFKTFPQLGLAVDDVVIINPVEGAATDTVAAIRELDASIDIKRLIKTHEIVVNGIDLNGGKAYIYTAADGTSNIDIFPKSDKEKDKEGFDLSSLTLDVDHLTTQDLDITYCSRKDSIDASAKGTSLNVKGALNKGNIKAQAELAAKHAMLNIAKGEPLSADIGDMMLKADIDALSKDGKADATLAAGNIRYEKGTVEASLQELKADVKADKDDTLWKGGATINASAPLLAINGKSPLNAGATRLNLEAKGWFDGKDIEIEPVVTTPDISFTQAGTQWLNRSDVSIKAGVRTDTTFRRFSLSEGDIRLNQFALGLDGDIALSPNDTIGADVHLKTNRWDIPALLTQLPRSVRRALKDVQIRKAGATLDLNVDGTLHKGKLDLKKADGTLLADYLDVTYNDSITVITPRVAIGINNPKSRKTNKFTEFVQGTIASPSIDAVLTGTGDFSLASLNGTYSLSNFTDKKKPFSALASLGMSTLKANVDTIVAQMERPHIDALMTKQKNKPYYSATLKADAFAGNMGKTTKLSTQSLAIDATALQDKTKKNVLDQWNPDAQIQLKGGHAELPALSVPIDIPNISLEFTPGKFNVKQSRIVMGNSDFALQGLITDLNTWLDKEGLLKADMTFKSDYTDVTQILDLVSGMGSKPKNSTDTVASSQDSDDSEPMKEDNPFMVPEGVDVRLRTDIKTANWNGFKFNNVGGRVTCSDGSLVAEQLGFTSQAATMQLTAMYKSPRKNHLYAGLDFHLIDVEIDKLIELIPKIDSIVPMLKEFEGQAQFHLAGETYMKSNYDLKLSTLRGAATVEGKDLKVLDSNTFATIKKYLMTDRQAENKIDSMDVEIAVFRDEVDVYPFRIRLGQYEAIVGGRHNINKDFDFNYHISVTDTPLPVRLGLNIDGTLDDMKFKLVTPKYTNLYKPEKRGVVATRSLELKKAINESLKRNVKSNEYFND